MSTTTRRRGMGSHQSAAMISDTWLTPPEIIHALGHFDLDPATPEFMPWQTAAKRYTKADNGLVQPWAGRVWLNPPYSRDAEKWLEKLADHGNGIALIFARTETRFFFSTVWAKASGLLFLEGRLYFHNGEGKRARANAGAPSVLVAYGTENARILKECGIKCHYVTIEPQEGQAV